MSSILRLYHWSDGKQKSSQVTYKVVIQDNTNLREYFVQNEIELEKTLVICKVLDQQLLFFVVVVVFSY